MLQALQYENIQAHMSLSSLLMTLHICLYVLLWFPMISYMIFPFPDFSFQISELDFPFPISNFLFLVFDFRFPKSGFPISDFRNGVFRFASSDFRFLISGF